MHKLLRKPETLIFLVSLWIVLTCNAGFWQLLSASFVPVGLISHPLLVVYMAMLAIGLTSLIMLLLAAGPAVRVILALSLLVCSATGFFTAKFGILFDDDMLVNVVQTNTAETFDLMSFPLVATIVLLGMLPAILVFRYPLNQRRLSIAVLERGGALLLSLVLIATPLFLAQKEIFSFARNNEEVRHMIAPLNVVSGAYWLIGDALAETPEYRFVGLDAVQRQPGSADERPSVHVLIVGETARSASFSLDGYSRQTNPHLQDNSAIRFLSIDSCGTATAVSLPCMFSAEGRENFDRSTSQNEDNLLDIASRAGYKIYWIDNGNECKGVCAHFDYQNIHASSVDTICPDGECYDEILVHQLKAILPEITGNTLIVLHQLGSHGPAYFKRYPESFRTFLPDCQSADMGECSNEAIVNSYDNTILYTDYVISSAIDVLSANSGNINASLIYVSDHGESLGEHNVYLHGMPYKFAPEEQTKIPMVIWLSDEEEQAQMPSTECYGQQLPLSHDNLIHTELGLLAIETSVYEPSMDILQGCSSRIRLGSSVHRAIGG